MPILVTDFYSDHDMACPGPWYGGFKQGRVEKFGDGDRTLSNMFTGDWQGSTFNLTVSDFDQKFRRQLRSGLDRYWTLPLTIRMTTRANRAALGIPYTVFVGPIIEVKPESPLSMTVTLSDIISEGLLSDDYQVPWRLIRDGFVVRDFDELAESLDLDAPEPIIYGVHRRIPDITPASPQGFQVTPIYLGLETTGVAGSPSELGAQCHVWMVCGHACADLPEVLVWTHDDEGRLDTSTSKLADPQWFIPHTSAPAYEDRRSATYGNDRRYTLIRALVGNADADAVVGGELTLAVFVDGVEPVGDGSGTVIQDRIQQYKHFLQNFVVNRGPQSYQTGPWLATPIWDLFDGPVLILDEASFDACSAIGEFRLPASTGSPAQDFPAGYVGAAIIGAKASDRVGVRRWISDWNRSCGVSIGATHDGQLRVTMLSPTAARKAAALLYTDAYEILLDSFGTDFQWGEKANRIPWRADMEPTSGQFKTAGVVSLDDGIIAYGREIVGDTREYPFAPGETMASHLARLEALIRLHPPRVVTLEATIGPNPVTGESLGYADLGDYIRYRHFDAIADLNEERLGYIIAHQVQVGTRRIRIEVLDCEELIDFDAPVAGGAVLSSANETCDSALVIPAGPETTNYSITLDTTAHSTDGSVDTSVLDGTPAAAHHAAWWSYVPPIAQYGHVTTGQSGYDTVLAVYRGTSCGDLELVASNDNDGIFTTSFIEFIADLFFDPAYTYYFVAMGYHPDDTGTLVFTLFTEPLS